jgi:hypothetical protein
MPLHQLSLADLALGNFDEALDKADQTLQQLDVIRNKLLQMQSDARELLT